MTLGELIERLEATPGDFVFTNGFGRAISWRGSYDELAFEPASNVSAKEMLTEAKSAVKRTFSGYKGGEYRMDLHTPVHIARYGEYGGDEDALTTWRWQLMVTESR